MQRGQPLWDKIFLATLMLVWIGWVVLIGLDARFRWSAVPVPLQAAGAAGIVLGYAIIARVFDENTFLAPVVKIQKERGHRVISTGPYAIVRHPMYAGAAILIPSIALLLGSWPGSWWPSSCWRALPAASCWRNAELRASLDGYSGYAARVRYRLLPFVW